MKNKYLVLTLIFTLLFNTVTFSVCSTRSYALSDSIINQHLTNGKLQVFLNEEIDENSNSKIKKFFNDMIDETVNPLYEDHNFSFPSFVNEKSKLKIGVTDTVYGSFHEEFSKPTVIEAVYGIDKGDIQKLLDEIVYFTEITEEEKAKLCEVFNIAEEIFLNYAGKGYTIFETIIILDIASKYNFTEAEIQNLFVLHNKEINKVYGAIAFYMLIIELDKPTIEEQSSIKHLILHGYEGEVIRPAFIIASALGTNIESFIKEINSKKLEDMISLLSEDYTQEEIEMLKNIFQIYDIDAEKFLNYVQKNNLDLAQVYEIIRSYLINKNIKSDIEEDLDSFATLSIGETSEERDFDKYFNSPFDFSVNGNENIQENTGALKYENSLLSIPGRNGLDLNLILRYNSSKASLNKAIYEEKSEDVYVYAAYANKYVYQSYGDWGCYFWNGSEYIGTFNTSDDAYWAIRRKEWDTMFNESKKLPYYSGGYVVPHYVNTNYYYVNNLQSNTYSELRNNVGAGWNFGFSSIEIERKGGETILVNADDFNGTKYLHLSNGETYKIQITTNNTEDSNLENYKLKDLKLEEDSGNFNNGQKSSAYVLIHKDGLKEYFADDGRLLGIVDRYNNTIKFQHTILNNYPVITKIIDSVGRTINITYSADIGDSRTVIITTPDSSTVELHLENLPGHTNKYFLKKIIDQEKRETVFNYEIVEGDFTINSDTSKSTNYLASMTSIKYPTGAESKYTYENATGNYGYRGYFTYRRVKERINIDKGRSFDKQAYTYTGNYTGYPTHQEPNNLPSEFTYTTMIQDENNCQRVFTFNNKGLKISEELKEIGKNTIKKVTNEYNANKLKIKENTISYDPSGTSSSLQMNWNYNDYGDVLEFYDSAGNRSSFTYENNHHQLTSESKKINDNLQLKNEYQVDSSTGNVLWKKQVHYENGQNKSIMAYYNYDQYGNIKEIKTSNNDGSMIIENYEYSSQYGNAYLTKYSINVTDYAGNKQVIEEKYTYDFSTGRKLSTTDGRNNITRNRYDAVGRLIEFVNPDNSKKTISYNDNNNTVTLTLENNHQIRNTYDGLGRLTKQEELKNGIWITVKENYYNKLGQLEHFKDANNHTTYQEYDKLNRIIKITNPDGGYKQIKYFDGQRMKIEINEDNDEHILYYDALGNVIKEEVKPRSGVVYTKTYRFDYLGNTVYEKDPKGNETRYDYDDLGRLIQVTNAKNEKTKYAYNNRGQLIRIMMYEYDASGRQTKEIISTKEYDELGRIIKATDPLGKYEVMLYDKSGNIIKKIDKEQQESTFVYDNMNRMTRKQSKNAAGIIDINVSYDYSKYYSQNIITIADKRGTTTLEYYPDGKLKRDTQPNGKYTHYEYDSNGNKRKVTDPLGLMTEYTYDSNNRMHKIIIGGSKTFTYEYYNDGTIKSLKYPNASIKTEFSYDKMNRLTAIENTIGSTGKSFNYDYDGNSNVISIIEGSKKDVYGYDQLNRLTSIRNSNNGEINYERIFEYDARGNRTKVDGDLTKLSNFIPGEFKYDSLNQLTQFITNGHSYNYTYDYRGLRVKKNGPQVSTEYYYDNNKKVIAEVDSIENASIHVIWGHKPLARKVNNNYYYYIYNGHGDVIYVVDDGGNIKNSYEYDEWGNITNQQEQIKNPIKYCGEYFDEESGLYYLRARYYDPTTGRFITKDSYEGEITNPLSMNQYIYCMNNPLIYEDPSGHFIATIIGGLSGAIIGGISAVLQKKDIGTGIISGFASGAIAGAGIDLTYVTFGAAAPLGALMVGGAAFGGFGGYAGNTIDQIGNRWKWGQGESLSTISRTLDTRSMWISAGVGVAAGGLSGTTGYGLTQITTKYAENSFALSATNSLVYGNNQGVYNTMNGIFNSSMRIANSQLRADTFFTTFYNTSSAIGDYYINRSYNSISNYSNNYFNNTFNNYYQPYFRNPYSYYYY
ncbi:RHS repeat domain-containing protein [Clostridium formicaceticum]|uniref:tRNA(Glu)-specific nuclease WapA n=1 Tax=Clostridium formicaceticum TaxID=1497 RepID=A0AAC9WF13_9CLOT|nr:RHS repeat-associated core domain-containing protein [Clostridium formicaceticum]AOY76011.1 hypothetical protein BJL90_08935 [Clostridium formicaceticum]ARE86367.1 tRNA(Glu)-specific nuclease WapA precursor [Clostridium formicaceticum]